MKYIIFFLSMILFLQYGKAQDTNWQSNQRWILYKIPVRKGFSIPVDSLSCYKSIELDMDKMKTFLASVKQIPTESYAWMGLYVASYEDRHHKRRKALFSNYAGFIYDETSDRYFQIVEELRTEWLRFLMESSKNIK